MSCIICFENKCLCKFEKLKPTELEMNIKEYNESIEKQFNADKAFDRFMNTPDDGEFFGHAIGDAIPLGNGFYSINVRLRNFNHDHEIIKLRESEKVIGKLNVVLSELKMELDWATDRMINNDISRERCEQLRKKYKL